MPAPPSHPVPASRMKSPAAPAVGRGLPPGGTPPSRSGRAGARQQDSLGTRPCPGHPHCPGQAPSRVRRPQGSAGCQLRVHAFFLPFWWPRYTPSGRPAPPAALSQLSQPPSPRPGGPAQVVPGRTHGTFRVCPHLLGVRASFSDGTEGPSWPRILSPTVRGGVHLPEPPANLGT